MSAWKPRPDWLHEAVDSVLAQRECRFELHPELQGTRLERLAQARLQATSARVRATHGQPREAVRRFLKALRLDPRAVGYEIAQIVQAAWGHVRYAQLARMFCAITPA